MNSRAALVRGEGHAVQGKEKKRKVRYKQTFDYTMIVTLVLLLCIGLVMVYSSSYYIAELNEESSAFYFLKQLICVAIGALFMIFFMFFDYHYFFELPYKKYKWLTPFKWIKPYWAILIFGLITLGLVFVPGIGVELNGSRRWINVGISIQPSEIMKVALIIFISCSIGKNPKKMRYFTYGMLPFLAILLVACAIIYKQPNFSAIMCIVALVMCMLYVGGARLTHLGAIIATVGIAAVILVTQEDYRADRLSAFTDPMSSWQVKQSLISFGAGGFFGRGLGNSMQKMLYLPYRESDFIFAIIAEELGFVGCFIVIALFAILIWRGIVAAMRARDLTGMLLATGSVAMIAIQVVLNIGVNTALLPATGVVLPFISYGGSSVLMFMSMVGVALNVSRQGHANVPAKKAGIAPKPQKEAPKDAG